MMTVSAIIAGLLPIMFGSRTGLEVMHRIAAPMVGEYNGVNAGGVACGLAPIYQWIDCMLHLCHRGLRSMFAQHHFVNRYEGRIILAATLRGILNG